MQRTAAERRVSNGANGQRRPVHLTVDGEPLEAFEGDTVAAALLAAGRRTLRHSGRRDEARGLFCGMGVCFECLMRIDGRANVQACLVPVAEGMRIETQNGAHRPSPDA